MDHLTQRTDIDTSRIVVFGRSLGGAVGTLLAKNNPDKVATLILENTFTSILDMAGVLLPFLKYFIGGSGSKGLRVLNCLVRSPWSTIDVIGQVKQPVLFLSGLQDEMVPPSHMQMLYAKAAAHNNRCLFVEFSTGMHMDTWLAGGDRYWRTIQLFLEQNVPEKKENGQARSENGKNFSLKWFQLSPSSNPQNWIINCCLTVTVLQSFHTHEAAVSSSPCSSSFFLLKGFIVAVSGIIDQRIFLFLVRLVP